MPLLNGFIGEFLVLSGAFQARAVYGVLAATGVIWSAANLLWVYQRTFFGVNKNPKNASLHDMYPLEKIAVLPTAIAALIMGITPILWLKAIDPAVHALLLPLSQMSARVVGQ